MNKLEREMARILTDLKQNHHVAGVKAEFEAEGTRMEEAMRLKEVVAQAGLEMTIKVGGCEALKDMYDAKVIGVSRIVGPMIESAYALTKFIKSAQMTFPKEEGHDVKFLINIETMTSINNLDEMLASPAVEHLHGVVIGRTDLSGSIGLHSDEVNSDQIFNIVKPVAEKCKKAGLEVMIGGGVSAHFSLPFFKKLPEGVLSRYETRKVIFQCPGALGPHTDAGILKAVGFELMWLKNKRAFYGAIHHEDAKRIELLESKYKKMIEEAGGSVGNIE